MMKIMQKFCSLFSTYPEYENLITSANNEEGKENLMVFVNTKPRLTTYLPSSSSATGIVKNCDQFNGLRDQEEVVTELKKTVDEERKWIYGS